MHSLGFHLNAQQMKFSIEDFFSKCDKIRRKLKKFLMENFIFCAASSSVALESVNFNCDNHHLEE